MNPTRMPLFFFLASLVSVGSVLLAGGLQAKTGRETSQALVGASDEQSRAQHLQWLRERVSRKFRSWLLTGNERFANETRVAETEFASTLAELDRVSEDDPEVAALLARIHAAEAERARAAASIVALHAQGLQDEVIEAVETNLQPITDRIDPAVAEVVALYDSRMAATTAAAAANSRRAGVLLVMASVLGLTLSAVSSRLLYQTLRRLRTEAEDDRRRERDRFFDLSMDLVCIAGTDGYFKQINPAFEAVTGFSIADLTQAPYLSFVHPEDMASTETVAARLAAGAPCVDFQNRYRRKDGGYRWLSWRCVAEPDGLLYAVARDVTKEKEATERLETMAQELRSLSVTDDLTGLHNRRGFHMLANQQLKLAIREAHPLLFFFADLDGLKRINDTLGHDAGDDAIRDAALVLSRTFRTSDILARMGGDEFVVLVPGASVADAPVIEARLRYELATLNVAGVRGFQLEMSVGTTYFDPTAPATVEVLLQRADAMMYEQKMRRKSCAPATAIT
jgi:diguanylate cyclase (GGDEF)-like protein/PAS domain S-box-containing protein